MSEGDPRKGLIYKVVMAVSERDAPPGQCVDIGYLLSFDQDFVRIFRLPRAGSEFREGPDDRAEEVYYGRTSVRVVSLENELLRKQAAKDGAGKVVLLRPSKQIRAFKVPLGDAVARNVQTGENS
jgi:hypothetical protein